MTFVLKPKPGFNWLNVGWGGPDKTRTDKCSYCGDQFPEDDEFVPLILFNDNPNSAAHGFCAEFCDHCQATWFGLQSFPEPVEPRKDAS